MIKVIDYFAVKKSNSNTVAIVNLYIEKWGLYLFGCRYIRKRNGGFFVAFPCKEVDDGSGEKKYYPHFCFDKEVSSRFQSAAQKSIRDYIDVHAGTDGS